MYLKIKSSTISFWAWYTVILIISILITYYSTSFYGINNPYLPIFLALIAFIFVFLSSEFGQLINYSRIGFFIFSFLNLLTILISYPKLESLLLLFLNFLYLIIGHYFGRSITERLRKSELRLGIGEGALVYDLPKFMDGEPFMEPFSEEIKNILSYDDITQWSRQIIGFKVLDLGKYCRLFILLSNHRVAIQPVRYNGYYFFDETVAKASKLLRFILENKFNLKESDEKHKRKLFMDLEKNIWNHIEPPVNIPRYITENYLSILKALASTLAPFILLILIISFSESIFQIIIDFYNWSNTPNFWGPIIASLLLIAWHHYSQKNQKEK